MTQIPETPVVTVKAQPNVYTALLAAAIVVLGVTIGLCLWKLMSPLPTGYALEFGQLFESLKQLK